MSKIQGQPVTIDNKPGAGGNISSDFVAKNPGDGNTLLIATVGTQAINPAPHASMPYNHLKYPPRCGGLRCA